MNVELTGGKIATVSVFNVKATILSLLQDKSLMSEENLAQGYDLFSGKPTKNSTHYREVHTGDVWEPACQRYCGYVKENMSLALIFFADKSHFDQHGALSKTPFIFTLSCFNKEARARADFWRPTAYLTNLNYGTTSVSAKDSCGSSQTASVQDKHMCVQAALSSLKSLASRGEISTVVKGRLVVEKV